MTTAILLTGLLAGVLDGAGAVVVYLIRGGRTPARIFNDIARGAFGPAGSERGGCSALVALRGSLGSSRPTLSGSGAPDAGESSACSFGAAFGLVSLLSWQSPASLDGSGTSSGWIASG